MEPQGEHRPGAVADGRPPRPSGEAGDDGDGILGLAPGHQPEDVGPFGDPRRLQAGYDQGGLTPPGQHQHGEAFQGHGPVAGEVGQVGADGEQQHIDAGLLHAGPGPGQAVGVHARRLARRDKDV